MNVIKEESTETTNIDSTPEKVEERPSSPHDCAICLEQLTNKSFTNNCLHMFCFRCLLAWSKVKAECPLCKQDFHSIIHNIRSMTDYDEYHVPPVQPRLSLYVNPDLQFFSNFRRFFSYRTTITSNAYGVPRPPPSNLVIQPYVDNLEIQSEYSRYGASHTSYLRQNRREIYLKDLETLPPPSEGRYRECSPNFYRENEAQIHRLGRWLLRELTALSQIGLRFNPSEVLRAIVELLPVYDITSTVFYNSVNRYLGMHTARFIREFRLFATSPFEMEQYDRDCVYIRQRSGSQLSFIVTVGSRDDSEDVQVIPRSNHQPFRPWIDVNDLTAPRPSTSSSQPHIATTFSRHTPSSTCSFIAPTRPPTSQAIINISDSENDDCVIIEEVRNGPETIILDNSDDEQNEIVPSQNDMTPLTIDLSSEVTSSNCENSVTERPTSTKISVEKAFRRNEVHVAGIDRPSCSYSRRKSPQRSSSILSTELSSDKGKLKYSKKSKQKRSKKYYEEKRTRKTSKVSRCSGNESIDKDLSYMLMSSPSAESDAGDSDWCSSRRKTKRKSRKMRIEKNTKRRKRDASSAETKSSKRKCKSVHSDRKTTEKSKVPGSSHTVTKAPELKSNSGKTSGSFSSRRLRSVVRKVENRSDNLNPNDSTLSIPSTSKGYYSSHNKSYSSSGLRTIYSSDTD